MHFSDQQHHANGQQFFDIQSSIDAIEKLLLQKSVMHYAKSLCIFVEDATAFEACRFFAQKSRK